MNKFLILIFLFFCSYVQANDDWKESVIVQMNQIPGWCEEGKAIEMMNIILENNLNNCVDIGVFSGKSLFLIAQTMKHKKSGIVYGIDAWDPEEAVKGLSPEDANFAWWLNIDYDYYHKHCIEVVKENKLKDYCMVVKKSSLEAEGLFLDDSIDLIHLDGNHSDEGVWNDVTHYYPKVKTGGYIILNDANWPAMRKSVVFLAQRCDLITPFTAWSTYLIFKKGKS